MGKAILDEPELAELCERSGGDHLRHLLTEAGDDELRLTQNAQPALCFAGIALTRVLREAGLEPAAAAGHSVGEYAALACAGVLGPEDALATVTERGRAMAEAIEPGRTGLSAVLGLDPDEVAETIAGVEGCWPANYNTPTQTVIGGSREALEQAAALLKARGARRVVELKVSAAFHTPAVAGAAERLRRHLDTVAWRPPRLPVMANLTGAAYPPEATFAELLERQLKSPVRWSDCVRSLRELGVSDFVEVGPRRALAGMLKELAPGAGAHAVATPAAARELAESLQ
jgi:[acyl-carrier-protein] S-malonyltransferase